MNLFALMLKELNRRGELCPPLASALEVTKPYGLRLSFLLLSRTLSLEHRPDVHVAVVVHVVANAQESTLLQSGDEAFELLADLFRSDVDRASLELGLLGFRVVDCEPQDGSLASVGVFFDGSRSDQIGQCVVQFDALAVLLFVSCFELSLLLLVSSESLCFTGFCEFCKCFL